MRSRLYSKIDQEYLIGKWSKSGMTQLEFSKIVGVDFRTFNHWVKEFKKGPRDRRSLTDKLHDLEVKVKTLTLAVAELTKGTK
jgi:hypothetical protein